MDAIINWNCLAGTSNEWGLFFQATGCLVFLIALAYRILHWLDRRQNHRATREITIQMPLGSDEKLLRLEKHLARRHMDILQAEWRCDFAQDRESVTFRVALPSGTSAHRRRA